MTDHFRALRRSDDARVLRVHLELFSALALVDDPAAAAWLRCRAAAHRYLDAARDNGLGPDVALERFTASVLRWAAPETATARRARLDAAVPFWVGTVYGLRWRDADRPDAAGHASAGGA